MIPPIFTPDEQTHDTPEEKTNILASFFVDRHIVTINKSDRETYFPVEQTIMLMKTYNAHTPHI